MAFTQAPDPNTPVWDAKGKPGRVVDYSPESRWHVQNTGVVSVKWITGITSAASWRELRDTAPAPGKGAT